MGREYLPDLGDRLVRTMVRDRSDRGATLGFGTRQTGSQSPDPNYTSSSRFGGGGGGGVTDRKV
jgi:hypothetical protein